MGKSSPSPPPAPDPYAVSAAQTGSNVNTAVANSVLGNANTYDPYGSTVFNQIGTQNIGGQNVPQYEKVTSLAPAQQQMFNLQNQTGIGLNQLALNQTNAISNLLSQPVTSAGLPSWSGPATAPTFNGLPGGPQYQVAGLQAQSGDPTAGLQTSVNTSHAPTSVAPGGPIQNSVGPQDFSADRDAVTQAYLDRMNPQLDRDRSALYNQAVNQGFVPGTQAFDTAMDSFNRQANDARSQAILAGSQEQSRLAGLQLQQGQFANQAQQQGFGQNLAAGQFAQQGVNQNNQTGLAAGQFGNQAQAQSVAQQQAQLAFNNAVAQGNAQGANDAANQAYQNVMNQIQYGNSNTQQSFTNQTSNAQQQNQLRQAQLAEQENLQSFPINQITALMSGGQVQSPQSVNFNPGQVAPTNVSGNVYNSAALAQQNYQSQLAQQNAAMGGLFGLGSAALMGGMSGGAGGFGTSMFGKLLSSDRRLKRDIVDTGIRLMNGLKLYAFRYLDDVAHNIGLMADEVLAVKPQAVHSVGGYLAVNYDMAMEAA